MLATVNSQLKTLNADPDFSNRLLGWYDRHGRKHLPWQQDRDPYKIWLSEIMLQQTQVKTVIPYFQNFIKQFPDISTLARSELDHVLHHWTGLGYYARARHLYKTAKIISDKYGKQFPRDITLLRELPGIGRSTAGAILALAFDQHQVILDGNVKRVLTRYHAIPGWPGNTKTEKLLWECATTHTPEKRVAHYTQAIMDLGATLCTRSHPACDQCPLNYQCIACKNNSQELYPEPKPRRILPRRFVTMAMIQNQQNEFLLLRRPPIGIWGGLWCFPELEQSTSGEEKKPRNLKSWARQTLGMEIVTREFWPDLIHNFTHFHLTITPVHAQLVGQAPSIMENAGAVWYNPSTPDQRGLAAPVKKLLEKLRTPE